MNLYAMLSNTCGACKAMEPELSHVQIVRRDVTVIRRMIDVSTDGRDIVEGFRPRMTPAFAITHGGELIATHQGGMNRKAFAKFLDDAAEEVAARALENVAGHAGKAKVLKSGAGARTKVKPHEKGDDV